MAGTHRGRTGATAGQRRYLGQTPSCDGNIAATKISSRPPPTRPEVPMLSRLMPREGKFFELFNAHAEQIVLGSRELELMMTEFKDLDARAQGIDTAERAADKITHETIALLHKTFITPLDRDQIHQLINTMDDVLD